jgi:spoIIIJ-associated protein
MENDTSVFSAPDVAQAIEQGLSSLGLARDQVRIEIVEEGRRGLLGLGARDAVVRLIPIVPGSKSTPETGPDIQPEIGRGVKFEAGHRTIADKDSAVAEPGYELSEDQVAETARQVLDELLSKMGIEGQVSIRRHVEVTAGESPPIVLDIQGDDLEILVGHRGKVLNALQHITRLIASREVEQWVDVVVDVERYKERRAKSLRKLAMHMAERVAQSAQPVALEPMPPNERREIHIALRGHPAVTTQSVGRGDDRRVTIIPKRS